MKHDDRCQLVLRMSPALRMAWRWITRALNLLHDARKMASHRGVLADICGGFYHAAGRDEVLARRLRNRLRELAHEAVACATMGFALWQIISKPAGVRA